MNLVAKVEQALPSEIKYLKLTKKIHSDDLLIGYYPILYILCQGTTQDNQEFAEIIKAQTFLEGMFSIGYFVSRRIKKAFSKIQTNYESQGIKVTVLNQ